MALTTTFKSRIEKYVGTTTDDVAVTQFLRFSAAEIIELIPDRIALRYSTETSVQDDNGFNTAGKKVLALNRNGYEAKEVSIGMKASVVDSGSIHFASARTPVFYIDGGSIKIKPAPSSSEPGKVFNIPYPDLAYDSTALAVGPELVNEAIVINASIKYLTNRMQSYTASIPAATTYNNFTHSANPPSLGDSPYTGLASVTYDSTGNATTVASVTDAQAQAINFSGITAPVYNAPNNTANFGSGNDFDSILTTEEDIEKASVELQKQGQLLADYQADIQNAVAAYNDTLSEYQTNTTKAIQDAQATTSVSLQNMQKDLAIAQQNAQTAEARILTNKIQETQKIIANNNFLLGRFTQDMNRYQANLNKEFQLWSSNLSKDLQLAASNTDRVIKRLTSTSQQLTALVGLYQAEVEKIKALT